ncbi:SOS response-associated peptidase [Endozoicomonas sp. G2_2]|uniref:SOS response-associated peptidase n=1 Tax=Endozoicomonas sp. G2_2 TaxID=2821092 RepID=UPI001ADB4E29|nr:SOS response-associated peptidase [Endozoicomonas sp. G2_2]MBO9471044.1 SOS response-associated peptidase [Endozoicomonas sp. G2_2]
MCGRYGRTTAAAAFAERIGAKLSSNLDDRPGHNLPPGTFQLCALINPDDGALTLGSSWWGFIPNWADNTKLSPINARSETAHEKKLFARAFESQRCILPADYWVEWQRDGDHKQPFLIRPKQADPFFFAGIWSKASRLPKDHKASGQVTFAILTGRPNDDIDQIHDRQPQALTLEGAHEWLNPDKSVDDLQEVLSEGRYKAYEHWPIDPKVGNPANNDASLFEPR